MSLVRASVRAQRMWGLAFAAALAGAAAAVLLGSGRTFGRGIHVEVEIASTGALHSDGKVRIAGREVGEVRGMRRFTTDGGERRVLVDCFVVREWAPFVRTNSTVFIATPSVLGEAYLEVGPPLGGAEPGPPVADGGRIRGVDPVEIDRMMARVFRSITEAAGLLREQRPALTELLRAGDELLTTLSGLPSDGGQLRRIRDQAVRGADDAVALWRALDEGQAVPRLRALARDLADLADKTGPELASLSARVDRAAARVDELQGVFTPERRTALARALTTFSRALDKGTAIVADVRALAARVERGEGTIGAFLVDKELFDDLHETHRILKTQPWTFILKPGPGEKTLAH